MQILEAQEAIVHEFQSLPDWETRYKRLIEYGRALPEMPEALHTDENKVKGCQSQVWMSVSLDGNRMMISADSDAAIVKGLVALLVRVYSGQEPKNILAAPPEFLKRLDLSTNLSQTRVNGLASMVKQIKYYAMAYAAKLAARP